jgi:phosphoribosylformylglycinamidine synthase
MKFGIVTFPGSNGDYDAYHAVVDALGEEATYLWHKSHDLEACDVIILPGGFSYGDYLRAGAIARFSPIMREVAEHAKRGGPVIGICGWRSATSTRPARRPTAVTRTGPSITSRGS